MKFGLNLFLNKVIVTLVTQGLPSSLLCELVILNYRLSIHLRILWFYILSLLLYVSNRNLREGLLASRFTLSHWAKSSVVIQRLTKKTRLCSRRCLPLLCPHWIQSMRGFRFRKKSLYWPGSQNAGAKSFVALVHSVHISRRTSAHARKNFWNPGTSRRCLGSRTYNGLRRCVSRRFSALLTCLSDLPSLCLSRPSRLMPLTRNASAARNNET